MFQSPHGLVVVGCKQGKSTSLVANDGLLANTYKQADSHRGRHPILVTAARTTTKMTTTMRTVAVAWWLSVVLDTVGGLVLDGTYGQFRKWDAGVNGTLEMEFKTRTPNGLLMYTDDGGTYDFFELKMVEGTMRLRYNLGAGAQILMAGHDLYDGRWHRVAVERRGRVTALSVDNATSAAASSGKELQFGRLASNSAVYVGGMPGWYNGRLTRLALPSVIFEPRFNGAVRNIFYADDSYPYPRRQTAVTDSDRQPKVSPA